MTEAGASIQGGALLDMQGITKVFPNGTVALRNVDFAVRRGQVHGLVGANGAGKSTLVKIVAGAEQPTGGTIRWRGEAIDGWTPGAARSAGIATVYQHAPLVPTLSVLENVFLGQGPGLGLVPFARQLERFLDLQRRLGTSLDPSAPVSELTTGTRQMVAFLQVLALGADLIILDEPTASLSRAERTVVFDAIRRLSGREGTGFVFVSHHLREILDLTDTVTVLRDGRLVARHDTARLTNDLLVREMTGAELLAVEQAAHEHQVPTGEVLLEATDVTTHTGVSGASLTLRAGEVVGLFGMMGSGRTELLRALFAADPLAAGSVRVRGRPLGSSTAAAVRAGIAFVPEDRQAQGVHLGWEIWRNTDLVDLADLSARGILDLPRELGRATAAIGALDIVAAEGPAHIVGELSGGNQQKVVFAKWLLGRFDVFLLDEPTVAIDVGAKAQILSLVRELAANGKAVLINSSEPDELLAVSDRILVLRAGRPIGERRSSVTSEAELLALAGGLGEEELHAA